MQIFHKDDFAVQARTDLHTCCCAVYIQCNQTTGRDKTKKTAADLYKQNLAIMQTHADLGLNFDLHSHGLDLTHSDSDLKQVQMSGLIITSWPSYDYRQLMML